MIKSVLLILLSCLCLASTGTDIPIKGKQSITSNSGTVNDPGGSTIGYPNKVNGTLTIWPSQKGSNVKLHFTQFRTEKDYDYLYIYNDSTSNPDKLIRVFTGDLLPFDILASNSLGVLTLVFTSDQDISYEGFSAEISNVDCPDYTKLKAYTSASSICPNYPFFLSLSDSVSKSNPLCQWQSSNDGIQWKDIASANTTTYSVKQQNASYYRALISCPNDSSRHASTSIFMPLSNTPCYCVDGLGGISIFTISQVSITGTSLNRNNLTNSSSYYFFSPSSSNTTTLTKGKSYELSTTATNPYQNISAWIDYDQDGLFEVEEWTSISYYNTAQTSNKAIINVPATARPGLTGLRIRSCYYDEFPIPRGVDFAPDSVIAASSCQKFTSGSTQDYYITIAEPTSCTPAIQAGQTISDKSIVCASNPFTLSLTHSDLSTDLNFQWQSSNNLDSGWVDILDADSSYFSTIQDQATHYRCKVSCGQTSTFSLPVWVNIDTSSSCYYLMPVTGNVQIKTCSGFLLDDGGEGNYSNDVDGSITIAPNVLGSSIQLTFLEKEWETCCDSILFLDSNSNASFPVPSDQTTFTFTSTQPDGSLTVKLKSDYLLSYKGFKAAISCVTKCDKVTSIRTISNVPILCSNELASLSLEYNLIGVKYRWQKSTTGNDWIDLPYTLPVLDVQQTEVTFYRCEISCGSSIFWSIPARVEMDQKPCYCMQNLNNFGCTDNSNQNIVHVSMEGTSLNNSSTCRPSADSSNVSVFEEASNTTANLQKNQTYLLSVACEKTGMNISAWIDFDQSGTFDAEEWTPITSQSLYTVSKNDIHIPQHALTGKTRMRIRTRNYLYSNTSTDACAQFGSGETEDYTLSILDNTNNRTGDIEAMTINLIPNPASDYVSVVLSQNPEESTSIALVDVTGKEVIPAKIYRPNMQLSLTGLPKGMYFLQLNGLGRKNTKILIVE